MQTKVEVPNVDCYGVTPDELRELGQEFCHISEVFHKLRVYANTKAVVMEHRLAGRVDCAVQLEKCLEAVYAELPKWAKW